jgi:two-component system sensor histidine kinase AtoS
MSVKVTIIISLLLCFPAAGVLSLSAHPAQGKESPAAAPAPGNMAVPAIAELAPRQAAAGNVDGIRTEDVYRTRISSDAKKILNLVYWLIILMMLAPYLILGVTSGMIRKVHTIKEGIGQLFYNSNYRLAPVRGELDKIVQKINELASYAGFFHSYNKHILESINSGVLSVSDNGIINSANNSFFRIFSDLDRGIIGRYIGNVFDSRTLDVIDESLQGHVLHQSREIRRKSKTLDVYSNHIIDQFGTKVGILFVFRDITLLKQYERELKNKERLALLGEMSLNVAHELRNPFTSIKGFVQLIQRPGFAPGKRREYLRKIEEEINRINILLNDMLIYGGKAPLNPKAEHIESLLGALVENFRTLNPEIFISLQVPQGGNSTTFIDKMKIVQVFENILKNSLHALENRPRKRITIRVTKQPDSVAVSITDCGRGISGPDRDKIFRPFFTTRKDGTGFGLPICEKIIEQHKGWIEVASKEGYYTKVTVRLPRKGASGSSDRQDTDR